jgi:hypothetical protein
MAREIAAFARCGGGAHRYENKRAIFLRHDKI